jgi:protein-L-isoaspartate(D-aspartate) O-methyltransferase
MGRKHWFSSNMRLFSVSRFWGSVEGPGQTPFLRLAATGSMEAGDGDMFSCLLLLPFLAVPQDSYAGPRMKMIQEQIEHRGLKDPDVLRAMRDTPRHRFVPDSEIDQAYEDHPVAIGYGATISQPYIVALMTHLLDVKRSHKVLEIGTGSGYQAAILSQLAEHVYSVEIVPELAASAATKLTGLGYTNVTVRQGDGYQGWPEQAPFDRIIVTAAPPDVPRALVDQLRPGGKMVAPIGDWDQSLYVFEKLANGQVRRTMTIGVRFVPMVKDRR